MGLGDIADKGKEEAQERVKEEKKDDVAEELGLEDKEDLEKASKAVERHRKAIMQMGRRLDDMQDDIDIIKKALSTNLHEMERLKGTVYEENVEDPWMVDEEVEEKEDEEEGDLPWQ